MTEKAAKLIRDNEGLILPIARRFSSRANPFDELWQEGWVALAEAAEHVAAGHQTGRFPVPFPKYAARRIRTRVVCHCFGVAPCGAVMNRDDFELRLRYLKAAKALGPDADEDAVVGKMGVSGEVADRLKRGNALLAARRSGAAAGDVLAETDECPDFAEEAERCLAMVSPRERALLRIRFGIGAEAVPDKAVAASLSVPRASIVTTNRRSLEKIRRKAGVDE